MNKLIGDRNRDTRKPYGENLGRFAELCGLDKNRFLDFAPNINVTKNGHEMGQAPRQAYDSLRGWGIVSLSGRLHGIFDSDEFRQ